MRLKAENTMKRRHGGAETSEAAQYIGIRDQRALSGDMTGKSSREAGTLGAHKGNLEHLVKSTAKAWLSGV